jgi:quercetin dioxygenase-like cupin family protein
MLRKLLPIFVLTACLPASSVLAQQVEAIKRTPLQKIEFPGDKMMSVMALIEVVPNGLVERHVHDGVELLYVIEGTIDLTVDGSPTRQMKAGDSAMNKPGMPHMAKAGPNGARIIGTFIVDKDKPLATPAK